MGWPILSEDPKLTVTTRMAGVKLALCLSGAVGVYHRTELFPLPNGSLHSIFLGKGKHMQKAYLLLNGEKTQDSELCFANGQNGLG